MAIIVERWLASMLIGAGVIKVAKQKFSDIRRCLYRSRMTSLGSGHGVRYMMPRKPDQRTDGTGDERLLRTDMNGAAARVLSLDAHRCIESMRYQFLFHHFRSLQGIRQLRR